MKSKTVTCLLFTWILCVCLLLAAPMRAQVAGATISGTITDPQGGALAGARVSARAAATAVTTDTTCNAEGAYNLLNLIPGDYVVSASSSGFSTSEAKVTLTVGVKQALNFTLTVGQMTQIVEVTGAAPQVELESSTVTGNIQGTDVRELPLNGRDWASLATLEPGVASVRSHPQGTQASRGLGVQMTISGGRPTQNSYRLDGALVNDYSNAGPGSVLGQNLGVDAIQEFSVLTSNYSAEYGFTSGGVINAITKSGTNSFHGSAYEFIRNSALDAADRFEDPSPQNPAGVKKGGFTRNQFGASAGWKVLKDKGFLFGDHEGLRQVKAVPQQGATLTKNARLGDINIIDVNGNSVPLPARATTGGPFGNGCPFANMTNQDPGRAAVCVDNTIFNLIEPAGTPAGRLSPLPNGPDLFPGNSGQFFSDGGQRASDNYSTVRGDLRISDKDSLSASWYRDTSTWIRPDLYNTRLSGFQVPHSAYTLEENHIISSAMVNTVRVGLNESFLYSPAFSDSNPVAHDTTLGILAGCVAPSFSIGGNGNSGNSTPVSGGGGFTGAPGFSARTKKIEFFDDLARTAGKHNLEF